MSNTISKFNSPLFLQILFLTIITMSLAGCGGGSGDTTPQGSAVSSRAGIDTATAPRSLNLAVNIEGSLAAGNLVGGVDVTIALPAGVTVTTNSANGEVSADAITFPVQGRSGSRMALARFLPAAAAMPALVRIAFINTSGINTGECLTLKLNVQGESLPTASAFAVNSATIVNLRGETLTGLAPTLQLVE